MWRTISVGTYLYSCLVLLVYAAATATDMTVSSVEDGGRRQPLQPTAMGLGVVQPALNWPPVAHVIWCHRQCDANRGRVFLHIHHEIEERKKGKRKKGGLI